MSRLHRFYIPPQHNKYGVVPLSNKVWIHDAALLHQWRNVLRFREGQELVLFDGIEHERLYRLAKIDENGAELLLITDFPKQLPARKVYLFWSLLKKDKNDWVLQKCTELGISVFVPLLSERSEKTGFSVDRAQKIIIEAAEQCGRSDIPTVHEPQTVPSAIHEYQSRIKLIVCDRSDDESDLSVEDAVGVLVGPEGGWSSVENELFVECGLAHMSLHSFTLRAETASLAAATKLL